MLNKIKYTILNNKIKLFMSISFFTLVIGLVCFGVAKKSKAWDPGDKKIINFIITLPDEINEEEYITLAGNINDWNPSDELFKAEKIDDNKYKLSVDVTDKANEIAENGEIDEVEGVEGIYIDYKWTLQNGNDNLWENVEVNGYGKERNNRKIFITNGETTIEDNIERFKNNEPDKLSEDLFVTYTIDTELELSDEEYISIGANINDWNPLDEEWKSTKLEDGTYEIKANITDKVNKLIKDSDDTSVYYDRDGNIVANIEYKITLQNGTDDCWAHPEVYSNGKDISNQHVEISLENNEVYAYVDRFKKIGDGKIAEPAQAVFYAFLPESIGDADLLFASDLNDWEPESDEWKAEKIGEKKYKLVVDVTELIEKHGQDRRYPNIYIDDDGYFNVDIEYTWVKKSKDIDLWEEVEVSFKGEYLDNRTVTVNGRTVVHDEIEKFREAGGGITIPETKLKFNVEVPEELPKDTVVAMACNLNNWKTTDSDWYAKKDDDNNYVLEIDITELLREKALEGNTVLDEDGNVNIFIEYKWLLSTLGYSGWEQVEITSEGYNINNRQAHIISGNNKYKDTVERFKKVDEQIEDPDTLVGEMDVVSLECNYDSKDKVISRNIRVLLPESYKQDTEKTYPVIYMHDGQNLFSEETATYSEWKIDEYMKKVSESNKQESIIVGIDFDEFERNYDMILKENGNELTASEYVDFIINVVKPYVDSNYRTKTEREYTTVGGSSCAGSLSLFMALKYNNVFGNVICFSASWNYVDDESITKLIKDVDYTNAEMLPKVFMYSGSVGNYNGSGTDDSYLKRYVSLINDNMISNGYPQEKIKTVIDKEMPHNETAWGEYFKEAYKFINNIEE